MGYLIGAGIFLLSIMNLPICAGRVVHLTASNI